MRLKIPLINREPSPFISRGKTVKWLQEPDDFYIVTGTLRNGRRFTPIRTTNWKHAEGINLWRGSKWLVRGSKRYLICRVAN